MIVKIVIRCFVVSFLFFCMIIGAWLFFKGDHTIGIALVGIFCVFIAPVMYSLVYWGAYGERIQQAGIVWKDTEDRIRQSILNASELGINKVLDDLEKIGAKNTVKILKDAMKSK